MAGKITLNKRNIKMLEGNAAKALAMATDATLTDVRTSQRIPFDQGTMQNDQTSKDTSEVAKGKAYIYTSAPQATRLYFHPEYNFQTVNNPNAGAGWFDPWVKGDKKTFAKNAFAKFYRQLNGG